MRHVQGLPTDDRESGIRQAGGSGSLMRRGKSETVDGSKCVSAC